jgi:hypothetical protein
MHERKEDSMRKLLFAAIALLVTAAAFVGAGRAGSASATASTVNVQLTKWMLEATEPAALPWDMRGTITGGDLGRGDFTGQVLAASSSNGKSAFDAVYNFEAGGKSFTARVVYTADDATLAATVSGEVTEGDFKGAKVSGTAQGYPECPISTPDNAVAPQGNPNRGLCFQLELQIETPSSQPAISPPSAGDAGLADVRGAGRTYTTLGLVGTALLLIAAPVVANRFRA